jgi:hypothetical protein
MKIISIDVGIKNLACCVLDIMEQDCKIVSWDIINLCNETNQNQKCSCKNKNKKSCSNIARYYKEEVYYCLKHANENKLLIEPTELSITKLKKKKVGELEEICKKYDIEIGIKELKKNLIEKLERYVKDKCLQKIKKTNANHVNLVDIGRSINEKLTQEYGLYDIDVVLIENQISPIANRMKTVQGMIAQYFIDKQIYDIHFVSSINKLKDFNVGKINYNERKAKSIEITFQLLKGDDKSIAKLSESKKKDDLADCFLQGYWFFKNKVLSAKNLKI